MNINADNSANGTESKSNTTKNTSRVKKDSSKSKEEKSEDTAADENISESRITARETKNTDRKKENRVKNREVLSLLRSLSPKTYSHNEKSGVMPRKEAYFKQEREICPVPDAGEKSGAGTPLPGGWEPQSHHLHRTSRRLLSGLPQRQQRWTLSPGLHQILCGRPAGTVGESDVLSAVQAGSGAGHGSWHPGGRLSIQRG